MLTAANFGLNYSIESGLAISVYFFDGYSCFNLNGVRYIPLYIYSTISSRESTEYDILGWHELSVIGSWGEGGGGGGGESVYNLFSKSLMMIYPEEPRKCDRLPPSRLN